MTIQRVFTIRCPQCGDRSVLPRQSHLGKFDDQPDQAKAAWPINYLCQPCGLVFVVPSEAIRPEDVEMPVHSQLFRFDFSNGQPETLQHFVLYANEKEPYSFGPDIYSEDSAIAIERILKPSGLWRKAYGKPVMVGIEPLGW